MSCFTNGSKILGEENIDTILEASRTILETGGDALQFSPIPGLDVAAGVLATLIGMIQQARGNVEAREQLAKQIEALAKTIQSVDEESKQAVKGARKDIQDEVKTGLHTSPELKERVGSLVKELESVRDDAKKLGKYGFFLRCLRSKLDADALQGFQDRLQKARELFMLGSQAMVEKIVNNVAENVSDIKATVTRMEVTMISHENETALSSLKVLTVEASYREEHNKTKSHYLKGTRNSILEALEKWSQGDGDLGQYSIYVLSGVAGTGKSTIAYEFAKRLEDKRMLGATFFFVRGSEKLSTARFVLPTIAYQLARLHEDLCPRIIEASKEHLKHSQHQQLEFHDYRRRRRMQSVGKRRAGSAPVRPDGKDTGAYFPFAHPGHHPPRLADRERSVLLRVPQGHQTVQAPRYPTRIHRF
ncbi:hypothetical protein NM688_g8823 [Phlebia brevispora]|uniref:Uncharacterized protein n=1 Tax=Phlebia brevispora TaxID=194682 RepID=A0ACC1RQ53_9APHY|nr:hypothetical protein NM688_g8823 [Phlebia brevispora]